MPKIKILFFCFFSFFLSYVNANEKNEYLIYVSSFFDKHPTYIKSYSIGYWVPQASLLKSSSKVVFPSSASCEAKQYGQLILALEPHLFYNPKMKTLYGTITTKVYGNDGKMIASFKTEDEVNGFLTVLYEKLIDQLYKKILTKVHNQIQTHDAVNFYLNQKKDPVEGSFCLLFN